MSPRPALGRINLCRLLRNSPHNAIRELRPRQALVYDFIMEATKKKTRASGSYSVQGRKVKILQTQDKHKLWNDLFYITESQITSLKVKIDSGAELDNKDMSKLDSCYNGMKKLLEIETALKSDAIASMTTEDLKRVAKKAIRESK